MEAVRSGSEQQWQFNNEHNEAIAHLTVTERENIRLHLQAQENPEFAVEYHTPDGVVTYKVMPGAGPSMDDLAMPTLPGPTTYKAAMQSANWRGWLKNFIDEIEGQIEVGCFHWAVLPPGHKLLNPICVFTQKLHADFTFERGKCRVVVDQSRGKPGEYADVSAYVAQLASWKCQVAVAVELKGKLYSGDWTQAYLNAINTAEQYMRVPEGIVRKYARDGTAMVFRLAKALYGGKGSAGLWDSCADNYHISLGFVRSHSDPRSYTLRRGTALINVIICTDDTSTMVPSEEFYPGSQELYEWYQGKLAADFMRENGSAGFTNKGLLKEFIGIKCEQNDDGTIVLDMTRYNEELVKRHGFAQAHRASAPGKPGKILSEVDCACPDDENPPDATAYRSKVGGCLWLCRVALPIIAYQVCALARFNHAPGKVHWDAVNDLMRYLCTCADPRIVYKRTGKPLYYYVDSDFLPNYGTGMDNRRSTTGYCAFLAGACVNHCSRRQTTLATSTAHAEYLAAFECGRDALRLRVLLADMGLPQAGATTIFEDNEICIRMSETKSSTPRMQYLDARYHWLREAVVHAKTIRLVHCSTTEMVADVLTKPLGSYEIKRFHGALSGTAPIPHPPFAGEYGRIGMSLHKPETMPLLSDV
jgi:hypothetical protein